MSDRGKAGVIFIVILGLIVAAFFLWFSNSPNNAKDVNYDNPGDYEVCVANTQIDILDKDPGGWAAASAEQTQAAFQQAKALCD